MKKYLLSLLLFFTPLSVLYAGGGITHMLIAQESIALLPDAQLRHLLLNNMDAYLVGAYYPDSGYIDGNHYGEDSHWDPFIFAFADYIRETYSDPAIRNPKLVAFLFGCAVHRMSDEIIHWGFYPISKDHDFNGDAKKTHQYSDIGIDILAAIDKNHIHYPATWWVPVKDLTAVYHRMGKDNYTSKQIIWGNAVLATANHGERVMAPGAYPFFKWKMPWTAAHYYNWPENGIRMDEQRVADYQMKLWNRLQGKSREQPQAMPSSATSLPGQRSNEVAINFAKEVLASHAVDLKASTHDDGSWELQSPVVNDPEKFNALLTQFVARLSR